MSSLLVCSSAAASTRGTRLARLADYVELTKPRIAALVLVTVAVGACMGSYGLPHPLALLHAVVGTALVAAGASAWNQLLERRSDARMPRTAARPLAAGRVAPREAALLGAAAALAGVCYLAVWVNAATALLAAATWMVYVPIYTPLKRATCQNTVVGAVAGALPVLIGWAAVGGPWNLSAAALFLVVYLWQFPHFMAIAWLYRRQYRAAGMRMLPVVDPSGRRAGRLAVGAALVLVPVSLLPLLAGAGAAPALGWSLMWGLAYFAAALRFALALDDRAARGLLRVSLMHLPAVLAALVAGPLL